MIARRSREKKSSDLQSLTPPRRLLARAAGKSAVPWIQIGARWVETMRMWGGLEPGHRVLDVGCGVGRMAIALASYLGDEGSYEGFDVQERAIRWCKDEIEPRWPQSRFHFVDVRNPQYHRGGEEASAFRFPFEDGRFDFVFMTSVFTHMLRGEVENYLRETRRVLTPHGRCLITYYLLHPDVRRAIERGDARYRFPHEVAPGCFVHRRRAPAVAVAFEQDLAEQLYRDAGLEIVPPIHHGSWSGAYRNARHGQDTIVAARR